MMLHNQDLSHTLAAAERIARAAGQNLRDAYYQLQTIIDYKGTVNLVTDADRLAEETIVSALREQFPDHDIWAEEGHRLASYDGRPRWLIDPLDGTTNFAHRFPVFAVSLALRDNQGALVGVVYDPLRDEMFSAVRGQGATLNGQPIQVTQIAMLDQALLATGFPYDRHTAADNNTRTFAHFVRRAQGMRRGGAAALDQAYVACGRLDGFWEMKLFPWDVAAGTLLVREAGGRVTSYEGGEDDLSLLLGEQIVASNGLLHEQMLAVLREAYPDGVQIERGAGAELDVDGAPDV